MIINYYNEYLLKSIKYYLLNVFKKYGIIKKFKRLIENN